MSAGMYNLIDEAWIPVTWAKTVSRPDAGDLPDRVGFRRLLLDSHLIEGLAIPEAPAHAALLRVLYALTLRVTSLDVAGPGDWGERRLEVWDEGHLPEKAITAYLDGLHDRFHLFDPGNGRPWMQDPRLREQCDPANTAGVDKLVVTRPSGNNHNWFGRLGMGAPHQPVSAADAALNLLVWHYWGPSGRCSSRKVDGASDANSSAGPLRTALSYHPEGKTLFETVLAGLVRPETTVDRTEDLCPWEQPALADPGVAPRPHPGPCSRLTARSQHALLLVPDQNDADRVRDAFITWAYRGERLTRDDDYLVWQTSQQGNRYPRPADSRRALWRDVDALLLKEPPGVSRPKQPKVFLEAHEVGEGLRVRALGFDQDGQAKDNQFVDAATPPVLDLAERSNPARAPAVAKARQLGEMYGRRLDRAVKRAWGAYSREPKAKGKTRADAWAAEAAVRYWPGAEAEFWHRFGLMDRTGAREDFGFDAGAARKAFLRLAEEAYDAVTYTITGTQRGAAAVFEARIELYGRPRKARP
ncbi:type I-E CRISPR-associated protein Cse1/CasA [Streptomyces virginiae]|uniref:type I-E CRISPR-associated protein Cse1/CasA n=1 Tax=Streptomyces virginiae TaxID=1961 RepID=UPI003825B7BF